ncbi:hypothetical protein ACFV7R_45210 [Streptomyces sp. NPDC059866]|uniref:hypothetical protein n=1 Tax=Streptomyces sp. NPDC059866 TaxID=3346978 RepID=UPI0036511E60
MRDRTAAVDLLVRAEIAGGTGAECDRVGLFLNGVGGLLQEVAALAELVEPVNAEVRTLALECRDDLLKRAVVLNLLALGA